MIEAGRYLRRARAAAGAAAGAVLARTPLAERAFIRVGRVLRRRSYLLSTVHYAAEDALVHRLAGRPSRFRQARIGPDSVWIDVADHTGRTLYFHGEPYEPLTTRAVQEWLRPGDTFLDIGANIGFFSVVAALRVGSHGHVVAVEPHPGARSRIAALAAVNGVVDRIVTVPAAAGAIASSASPLFLSIDSVLSTLNPGQSPSRGIFPFDTSVLVEVTTVDEWLDRHSALTPRIRLVKIDVEGTERDVLEGLRRTLEAHAPAIICETEPGGSADEFLRAAGYSSSSLDLRDGGPGNYLYVRPGARVSC